MRWIAGALSVVVLATCSSSGSSKSTPTTRTNPTTPAAPAVTPNKEALKDVTVKACGPDGARHVRIEGTAHNPTSASATYGVQLVIKDKAGTPKYYTAASASKVPPGATAQWVAATSAPYTSGMTCAVTSVSRN